MNLVFTEVEEVLVRHRTQVTASEFHGMLSGLICAGVGEDDIENWLPILCFENQYLSDDEYKPFEDNVRSAYLEILKGLESFGVGFNLLLPEDADSLTTRVGAMTTWCRGYLKAMIGYCEISIEQLPEDCIEFLDDVQQISELEHEQDPDDEELEASFMTLGEHLRVGVQLVYEQMNLNQSSDSEVGSGMYP